MGEEDGWGSSAAYYKAAGLKSLGGVAGDFSWFFKNSLYTEKLIMIQRYLTYETVLASAHNGKSVQENICVDLGIGETEHVL